MEFQRTEMRNIKIAARRVTIVGRHRKLGSTNMFLSWKYLSSLYQHYVVSKMYFLGVSIKSRTNNRENLYQANTVWITIGLCSYLVRSVNCKFPFLYFQNQHQIPRGLQLPSSQPGQFDVCHVAVWHLTANVILEMGFSPHKAKYVLHILHPNTIWSCLPMTNSHKTLDNLIFYLTTRQNRQQRRNYYFEIFQFSSSRAELVLITWLMTIRP